MTFSALLRAAAASSSAVKATIATAETSPVVSSLLSTTAHNTKGIVRPSILNASSSTTPSHYSYFDNSMTHDRHHMHQQLRFRITKTKKRRLEKQARKAELAARGIFPKKPPRYIPRDTPVVNAISRQERDAETQRLEQEASLQMRQRMEESETMGPLMRFHMEDVPNMSDRVRKLFDLHNGSQAEVIKAQKQRGMELFQLRDGDSGSSAVQVIALTTRIQQLQKHMRTHKKDNSTKRGLDALYVRRRKLLDYMERKDFESYRRVVKTLGLVR